MTIKQTLSQLTYCQAHALAQEEQERFGEAVKAVIGIMKVNDWEGLTQEKIGKATKMVQTTYPDLDWKVIVHEGIDKFLKE